MLFEIVKTININVINILTIGIKVIVTITLISDKLPISSSGIDLVKSKIRHILIGISQIARSVCHIFFKLLHSISPFNFIPPSIEAMQSVKTIILENPNFNKFTVVSYTQ